MPSSQGKLWTVATPIGNNGDLSPRARDILAAADLILAEDTRRTAKLLKECGLPFARLRSFHDHNEESRLPEILKELEEGATVALVSDAGSPLLADPGYRLVRKAREKGIAVSPAPGPSAPIAALSAAGLPPIPFTFLGFLPRGNRDRANIFKAFASCPGSLLFFERKDRLAESLKIAFTVLGTRELAICREMTKTHEEFLLGMLGDCENMAENLLGEITVIIGPSKAVQKSSRAQAAQALARELESAPPRLAAKKARDLCRGWTVRELYALAGELARADALHEGERQ